MTHMSHMSHWYTNICIHLPHYLCSSKFTPNLPSSSQVENETNKKINLIIHDYSFRCKMEATDNYKKKSKNILDKFHHSSSSDENGNFQVLILLIIFGLIHRILD